MHVQKGNDVYIVHAHGVSVPLSELYGYVNIDSCCYGVKAYF